MDLKIIYAENKIYNFQRIYNIYLIKIFELIIPYSNNIYIANWVVILFLEKVNTLFKLNFKILEWHIDERIVYLQ